MDNIRSTLNTAPTGGVSRRTVVAGAAWAAPVIATAVATPALAASTGELAVLWVTTAGAVPVNTVFGISEVTVSAAPAGAQVSFSLGSGLIWADNTTTSKLVTVVNGMAALPDVKATAVGSFTVTAIVGTASASTTLQATVLPSSGDRIYNFTLSNYATSPSPMVEMIVGLNWITVRSDDSLWYGYAYGTQIFRPLTFNGSPLVVDGEIKTDNSNIFYGLSNGEIYQADLTYATYLVTDNGKPVETTRRGAPPAGIVTWAANGAMLYAATTAGEWYVSAAGTTWAKVNVAYPAGQISAVSSIEGSGADSWALTTEGGVWRNQGTAYERTNALSPMRNLEIGTKVAYGAGVDGKWYAKLNTDYSANWTRVQYDGADFVLDPADRFGHAAGGDYSYVVRDSQTIYRTSGGGKGETQVAELIVAPAGIRDIELGNTGSILIAGEDGRVYQYTTSWAEQTAPNSVNAVQVGYRVDGAAFLWAIGKG